MDLHRWVEELRRRRVFRALIGYGIAAAVVLRASDSLIQGVHLPGWILPAEVALLGLGFPIAVALAWVFDLTSRGPERTPPEPGPADVALPRGPRLALALVALGLLAAAPGLLYFFVWRGGRAATAAAGPPSIAVLPFADMSPGKDQEYFSDGIAEEILNALAQVEGLRVAGRTSSFAFKGKNEDLSVIAAKLHVGAVLEGSVRKEGNRVRVTAQLINAADGFHTWSQTFDRELTGIFAVQNEIAAAVTQALEVRLVGRSPSRTVAQTANPEAYRLYLLGRQALLLGTAAGFRDGIDSLERAAKLDPGYAPAQVWLAQGIWSQAVFGTDDMTVPNARALASVERAIALAPDLPDGYTLRGLLRTFVAWDWTGAEADFQRSLSIAPGDVFAQGNYAVLLAATGRLAEALRLAERACEADPLSPVANRWLGVFQVASGRPDLAEATFRKGLEAAPRNAYLLRELGFAYLVEGKAREALALFEQHPVGWMRDLGVSLAQHQLGREAESRRALEALVATGRVSAAYQIAEACAWRGERDEAFGWLDKAYASNDSGLRYLRFDPLLRGLRGDARYRALLRKIGLPG